MQCDARSSVAEAKAMFILELEPLEFPAAVTAAKAAASPAIDTAECIWAFSVRALSFFFTARLLNSLWWNHFPNDPVLGLLEFTTFPDCKEAK